MTNNQPEQKLIQALKGTPQTPPPIWLMRQAGRYLPEYLAIREKLPNFMEFCFTSEAVVKATLQPIERFGFDAAIIFSDILTIPHLLGQTVSFAPGHGPILEKVDWDSFLKNSMTKDLTFDYQPLYQSIATVRKELPLDKSLIGFAGSPWTIATYMVQRGKAQNFDTILKFSKERPETFKQLLDLLTEKVTHLLLGQIKAGCDVVQIFDSWASAVPEEHQGEWLWNPLEKIYQSLKEIYPEVPIIYYGRGVSKHYPMLAKKLKSVSFGLDQSVDPVWAKEELQPLGTVQGNLDPEKFAAGEFDQDVSEILKTLGQKPFIFNLGHGILPHTPIKYVHQLIEQVRNYRYT